MFEHGEEKINSGCPYRHDSYDCDGESISICMNTEKCIYKKDTYDCDGDSVSLCIF